MNDQVESIAYWLDNGPDEGVLRILAAAVTQAGELIVESEPLGAVVAAGIAGDMLERAKDANETETA